MDGLRSPCVQLTHVDVLRTHCPAVVSASVPSPCFPPAVLDADGWARVFAVLGPLPVDSGAVLGLERRLDRTAACADVAVSILPHGRLARHCRSAAFDPGLLRGLDTALGIPWGDLAFLVYDVSRRSGPGSVPPGLYVRLASPIPDDAPDPAGLAGALAHAVGWPCDRRLATAGGHALRALAAAGPGNLWLGAMPARPVRCLRAAGPRIPMQALDRSLRRVGWRGPIPEVSGVVSAVCAGRDAWVRASLDISTDGPLARLGVECCLEPDASLWRPGFRRWAAFLEVLERHGWCRPDLVRALLECRAHATLVLRDGPVHLSCGIAHVKLVFREGLPRVHAKAYIAVTAAPPLGIEPKAADPA